MYLEHILHPLHIWCRLLDLHLSRTMATKLCRWYEFHLYRPIKGR